MSDADVIALQAKQIPVNPVTNWLFGTVPPGSMSPTGRCQAPRATSRSACTGPPPRALRTAARPLVVYFHGGGFALGGLYMGDWMCGLVAASVGAVVVSVDYRLAPSHVFPAAVEDCYAALAWAAGNAAELGATGRIGVMGESAGGNLAAVTCLIARERGGPADQPPGADLPGHRHDGGTARRVANPSAPFLSACGDRRLQAALLRPRSPTSPTRGRRRCSPTTPGCRRP